MSSAYVGTHVVLPFYKACAHMNLMIGQSIAAFEAAKGLKGYAAYSESGLCPSALAKQFTGRAQPFLALTGDEVGSVNCQGLYMLAAEPIQDVVIPTLDIIATSWDEMLPQGGTYDALIASEKPMHLLAENLLETFRHAVSGMANTSHELAMYVIPNTRFLLSEMGVAVR